MDQNSIVTIAEIQKAENKTFNSAKKINLAIENAGLIIAQEASINAKIDFIGVKSKLVSFPVEVNVIDNLTKL